MKEKFSSDEWKLLLNAPHWVYAALVAAERGSISTRRTEAKALEEFLSGYKTRSPLVKEIIAGQEEADDRLKGSLKDAEEMLGQVDTLLERKIDEDEGNAVRDMLMQAGQAVAAAAREALFGDAESAAEEKALARLEAALKATEADKRRRREAAAAQEAREAKARAAAERRREEAARAEAEKKAAEAEAKRKAAEAEAKKKAAEAKAKREAAEAEVKKKAAEAKAKREAAEAEAKREAAEAEVQRKVEEARKKREAEAKKAEEEKALREAEAMKREFEAMKRDVKPPAPTVQAAPKSAERIYVVKKGDTLSGIAKTVYGNAGRWREIFEANRDVIDKPNLIRPGWKLRIPD